MFGSLSISRLYIRLVVLATIKFDGEFFFVAIEIQYVGFNWMLAPKFNVFDLAIA